MICQFPGPCLFAHTVYQFRFHRFRCVFWTPCLHVTGSRSPRQGYLHSLPLACFHGRIQRTRAAFICKQGSGFGMFQDIFCRIEVLGLLHGLFVHLVLAKGSTQPKFEVQSLQWRLASCFVPNVAAAPIAKLHIYFFILLVGFAPRKCASACWYSKCSNDLRSPLNTAVQESRIATSTSDQQIRNKDCCQQLHATATRKNHHNHRAKTATWRLTVSNGQQCWKTKVCPVIVRFEEFILHSSNLLMGYFLGTIAWQSKIPKKNRNGKTAINELRGNQRFDSGNCRKHREQEMDGLQNASAVNSRFGRHFWKFRSCDAVTFPIRSVVKTTRLSLWQMYLLTIGYTWVAMEGARNAGRADTQKWEKLMFQHKNVKYYFWPF